MSNRAGRPPKASEETRCRLFVVSDSLAPEVVTGRTGTQPTTARHRGYRPRPGAGPRDGLPEHQWIWEPDDSVALTLDAQLDAIWIALKTRAAQFRDLGPEGRVVVDIVIAHYGADLSLGWRMHERHVSAAAEFGGSINVSEYDYTVDD